MDEEKAKLKGDRPIWDHVDKQDNLERTQSGQPPVVINVITTSDRLVKGVTVIGFGIGCLIIWSKRVKPREEYRCDCHC